ncbi:hypothetical protein VFPBJ_11306 [Purpureocillium lilacinum]|uniref:Uncharacterized protein n=1 Tax=Purpureocillium lilacinum TaxID=33203 RepID=A0A179FE45_PURLI|nr:hypothetical protein VFPBJ_11306 [Purpureocillium lilacinum]
MSTAGYSVTILNRSGETQSYILLRGSNVLAKIIDVPSPHGSAKTSQIPPSRTTSVREIMRSERRSTLVSRLLSR